MQSALTKPSPIARVLSLPAGKMRNAGLNDLACRYHRQLELYIRCELESTRWSGYLDAQDLVQSLYLKLLTVEPQEQIHDERHLVNWLQCVLRNHMLEKAKSLKARKRDVSRVKSLPDDQSAESSGPSVGGHEDHRPGISPRSVAPEAEVERREEFARYRNFLHQAEEYLPAADWYLFCRHHLEGVPQSDLADELERTPGAICQRLKRICAVLAERFPSFADLLESW